MSGSSAALLSQFPLPLLFCFFRPSSWVLVFCDGPVTPTLHSWPPLCLNFLPTFKRQLSWWCIWSGIKMLCSTVLLLVYHPSMTPHDLGGDSIVNIHCSLNLTSYLKVLFSNGLLIIYATPTFNPSKALVLSLASAHTVPSYSNPQRLVSILLQEAFTGNLRRRLCYFFTFL